ncbi:aminomethyl-transferring glycine dehydrogenase subunit GcvPB [Kordiimonas sp. SCSIO 12610]|uniref:aminomethyl-transferring glycine dehydrogenase subunit GcvPB n=1 Tax=Kordiimonas sp. SCSIO 12610 TaxID=2829597 RepID=UPI00210A2E31|nr:aminomethyl-transferring glycine dehydrogenase subunit GcvPB [Kordiimonas sp. SCSIO 12610]UTW54891.1 aminomethyl-transferring glycine dehydrogenase subunit GcvPB [Kordiimonas sp. SCSIO 12610]
MSMNAAGRPTGVETIEANETSGFESFSGHKGLRLEEPLIFEIGNRDTTGVDIVDVDDFEMSLGGLERTSDIDCPGLSEPDAMRHFTRLSRKNYGIDMGVFPLGSCTMKHNPRLNEKMARLPGYGDVHPLQPTSTVQGALELMEELGHWLKTLTGLPAVALSPKAGAHGELCGVMAIRAALEARGDAREVVLCPESAHGTNPATAAFCGYKVKDIPAKENGRVDLDALKAALDDTVACVMLTNPNTCGLFESEIREIADAVHAAGAFFYCDGANFNAIMGKVRPGDLGVDAMHINLHKTFSTPHGGGGPGSGPVVFSDALKDFVPLPYVVADGDTLDIKEWGDDEGETSLGRLTGFHGQMGMYVRALSYMLSHGVDGIRQAAEDAVLNANYVLASLSDLMSASYEGPCKHEALFDDRFLKDTGVTTLDFAKAMIDEGYHPMTMYFPLVVHGAMLIEPTETESKYNMDQFIRSMRGLANAAKNQEVERFEGAPYYAPMKRLDETKAARSPILRYQTAAE